MDTTRRKFIKTVAPMIVAPAVVGRGKETAPNSRINLACIGVGGQGSGNMRAFIQDERVQVTAICDVDQGHRKRALATCKLKPEDGYNDYRKLLARDDVDAVMIATPDHWHSLITVAAAHAGKDIYCEKPLAASIGESRFVSDLVRKEKRVLQCGTWRRVCWCYPLACAQSSDQSIGLESGS